MSIEKNITFSTEAREQLKKGADKVANAVKVTLGAKGRNVIIGFNDFGRHHITKDGVTVAKSIVLTDMIENLGANLIKEASTKTADEAGDGTTTSAILAQSIITNGMKHTQTGINTIALKNGIDKGVIAVVVELKKLSRKITDNDTLRQIATISANNDSEIGNLIADTIIKIGQDGVVNVEETKSYKTFVRYVDGIESEGGFLSPHFANGSNNKCTFENPFILLYERKIFDIKEILHILEFSVQMKRPILIICQDIEIAALQTIVINRLKELVKVCCINSPGFDYNMRDAMEDLAAITGGTFVTEEKGFKLEELNIDLLGGAEKIIADRDKTIIIGGKGTKEAINERCDLLKQDMENARTIHEKDVIKKRIAKIKAGIAVLSVGGKTETEIKEKADRIDDALCATRAALEEGFVAGGGVTYLKCIAAVKKVKPDSIDEKYGLDTLIKSLEEPFRQMMVNAGLEPTDYIKDIVKGAYGYGYNVKTDKLEDLFKSGVIDPTKVTRIALENAASAAGMFLTTECVVSDLPKPIKP